MPCPSITKEQIKDIKPNSNTTINEKRVETINQLTKACFGYFGTPREDINQQWESNCFLLDGKWGSGKSWTLDVIEAWIKRDEFKLKIENKNDIQFLKFSAWQYLDEKELFFDLYMGLDSVEDSTLDNISKNALNSVKWIGLAIQWFSKFGKISGFALTQIYLHLDKIALVDGSCTVDPVIISIAGILCHLKMLDIGEKGDDLLQKILSGNTKIKEQFDKKQKENKKIDSMKLFENFTPKQTIIVIDDLDRVHEDKLWRILTLLSLFDKQANLVFICVGSSEYLIKILHAKYHVKHEGENFLTKFFAREFQLKQDSYLELLVNEFVPETEWAEVLEFLNLFVDIPTYREYKTRYLQPLKEMKEDGKLATKEDIIQQIVNRFLNLRYKDVWQKIKSFQHPNHLSMYLEDLLVQETSGNHNLNLFLSFALHLKKIKPEPYYKLLSSVYSQYAPFCRIDQNLLNKLGEKILN